jgi:hypothetical protein
MALETIAAKVASNLSFKMRFRRTSPFISFYAHMLSLGKYI